MTTVEQEESRPTERFNQKTLVTLLGLAITVIGAAIALSTYKASVRDAETDLFIDLKNSYQALARELPADRRAPEHLAKMHQCYQHHNSSNWEALTEEQSSYCQTKVIGGYASYWSLAFREWFATNRLLSSDDLWVDYYLPIVRNALAKDRYGFSLCNMLMSENHPFGVHADGFIQSIASVSTDHKISDFKNKRGQRDNTLRENLAKNSACLQDYLKARNTAGSEDPNLPPHFVINGQVRTAYDYFKADIELSQIELKAKSHKPSVDAMPTQSMSAEQLERDEIFGLLAYAIVQKDWQTETSSPRRGHNIGAVLVHGDQPVFWARNANSISHNSSQHAEVRAIGLYLSCSEDNQYLKGYTVYTTLEPCAMCAGMMMLTKVKRVVYGQDDPLYGNVLARFQQTNSTAAYPRQVTSIPLLQSEIKQRLDGAYNGKDSITDFLLSDTASQLFTQAAKRLDDFDVQFPKNQAALSNAREFLTKVTATYQAEPLSQCL